MASTSTIEPVRAEAPISIYFGLEQGKSANLEIIAEAAISWVGAIREMAHIVDPSLNVSVEILDGDRSSLWINTLTNLESKLERVDRGGEEFPRLWALAKGFAFIVVATPLAVTSEDVWRAVSHDDQAVVGKLSPEAEKQLIADFEKALRHDVARPQKQQFYRSAEKDTSITEVGVAVSPKKPLALSIKRDRFVAYASSGVTQENTENTRKRTETVEVTLVSPVLENVERSWRFIRAGFPEFGAVMRDKAFLAAVEHGGVHIELRKGIQMLLEMEFREKFENNLWVTLERSVLQVLRPTYDRGELDFSPPAT